MLLALAVSLLNVALAAAQSSQRLTLNSLSSFSPSNAPNPPLFILPQSDTLTVSVAICSSDSQSSPPQFIVTNNTGIIDPGSSIGEQDVYEIQLQDGQGNWTGSVGSGGGAMSIKNIGQTSFEIAVSDDGPRHEHLTAYPLFGDTTANQALLFSPPFSPPPTEQPSYPNYTLPPANLSFPTAPSTTPNYTLVLAKTSLATPLTSLPQTGCSLMGASNQVGSTLQENLWLRDEEGWRNQWLVGRLSSSTNYTMYAIQDGTKVSGPMYFSTKSSSFACPLVHSLPYCPSVAYAVPLPPPPSIISAYDSMSIPSDITNPLLQYMTNFTTTLLTMACGRDLYSPLRTCADCQRAYRKWLCSVSFTRCGEATPNNAVSSASQSSTLQSALASQTASAAPRNTNLPTFGQPYNALLPCLETCTAVDRMCPNFLGFKCPVVRFNAADSYGVGYVDSGEDGVEGEGSTGNMQDRWGNVWCNGS